MIMPRSPAVDVPNVRVAIRVVATKTTFKRVDSSICPLPELLEAFTRRSKICIDSTDTFTTKRFFEKKRRNSCSNLYENLTHWGK